MGIPVFISPPENPPQYAAREAPPSLAPGPLQLNRDHLTGGRFALGLYLETLRKLQEDNRNLLQNALRQRDELERFGRLRFGSPAHVPPPATGNTEPEVRERHQEHDFTPLLTVTNPRHLSQTTVPTNTVKCASCEEFGLLASRYFDEVAIWCAYLQIRYDGVAEVVVLSPPLPGSEASPLPRILDAEMMRLMIADIIDILADLHFEHLPPLVTPHRNIPIRDFCEALTLLDCEHRECGYLQQQLKELLNIHTGRDPEQVMMDHAIEVWTER
jgi:hypothetical protein